MFAQFSLGLLIGAGSVFAIGIGLILFAFLAWMSNGSH